MSEAQRVSRSRAKPDRADGRGGESRTPAPAPAVAPAWAGSHTAAPFGLAGVQRKVTIGPAGDAYEREADRVSSDVAAGRSISPSAISPMGALGATSQRTTASGKKPEQDRKPEADLKAEAGKKKAVDHKKEENPLGLPLQKAAAPVATEKKKPEEPKPESKKPKEEPKKSEVKKAENKKAPQEKKPEEKKPEGKKPVQKAAAADHKKGDDKQKKEEPKKPEVKKAESPKKPEEKKAPDKKPVQKASADSNKRDDKQPAGKKEQPKQPEVKKAEAGKPNEKKPETKKPETKKPEVKKAAAAKPDEKKHDGKKPDEKKSDDKKPVQKAAAPGGPQTSATPKEKDREQEKEKTLEQKIEGARVRRSSAPDTVQRGASEAPTPAMESAASRAVHGKGAGEPIQGGTRRALESQMGVDLGAVRVHEDQAARDSARAIQARAFTHGSDIWLGPGESQSNLGLMAHEATHVVQQAGGVHRMLVQRAKPKPAPAAADEGDWDFESPLGKIKKDGKDKKISIPTLMVPAFKKEFTPSPLTLPKKEDVEERTDKQREIWENEARSKTAIEDKLESKLKGPGADVKDKSEPVFFLTPPKAENFFLIGTKKQIKERALRPSWDKEGGFKTYQVDHKQEVQLAQAGEDPDRLENFWLLESGANMASGRNIKTERNERIQKLLNAASKGKPDKKGKKDEPAPKKGADKPGKSEPIFDTPPDLKEVKNTYEITFEEVKSGLEPKGKPPTWSLEEIRDTAQQIEKLRPLTPKEIKSKNLQGSEDELVIYTSETGGGARRLKNWKDNKKGAKWSYGKRAFQVESVTFDETSKTGKIGGTAYKGNTLLNEAAVEFDIREMSAVNFGGYIPRSDVQSKVKKALSAKVMSPIELDDVELTERGFVGRGRLAPTIPLIKDAQIDVVLDGDDVYLSKTFTAGDFKFPGPIKVTSASLEIYAGTKTGVRGDVNIEIERVGRGTISGKGELGHGFSIEGQFFFDSDFFSPADVKVWYRSEGDVFGGEGNIGIPEGKVKGIKSASLKVKVENEKIDATGTVKPDVPGVEQGDLKFSYDPKTGVVIAGKLELKKDIPGLEGGSIQAELSKPAGADKWKVKAGGEVTPKIPGISSKLAVTYDDGAFDAVVTAGYEKGMLKGQVTVGATNRPVGDDGKPAGPPPEKGDKITIYGGGSVTLKIAPWLQATAGIKLLPNGEIEVTGEIGLPAALEIFKEKKFDKNIFKIGIDIPIVGVSVAGQRIGIFANISGGLDLSAGIGPGELNQLKLGVTYNPAHEEDTKVTGDANLHIPAHAGLRLFVRGSLGVGIPVVSASAGIEIGGALGLEGALDAGVHVEWTPTKGLDLTAQASVYVEPKLKFDITGFVLVEADLLLTTIELYSQRWQLASFEYGSGLKFGLKFPIHYAEGQPFDVSLSDIQFDVPNIEPGSLLEGLVKQIA